MSTVKKIGLVLVLLTATVGIILGMVTVWFAWAYNTPVTEGLTQAVVGTQRVLTAADNGLGKVNTGLRTALGAVTAIDVATRAAGDKIVETSFAFQILDRTVGDRLFPRVAAAQETVSALAATVIGINDTLEAANRLPFVDVPTLTTELEAVRDRLDTARGRVEELQTGIREIKEQKVSRPVSFVTDRTDRLMEEIDDVLARTTNAQARISVTMSRLERLEERLPGIIDLISIIITVVTAWFIGVQAYVAIRAYERLSGKRIDWDRLRPGKEESEVATEPPSVEA